jgi:hypothetical protein
MTALPCRFAGSGSMPLTGCNNSDSNFRQLTNYSLTKRYYLYHEKGQSGGRETV